LLSCEYTASSVSAASKGVANCPLGNDDAYHFPWSAEASMLAIWSSA